MINLRLFCKTLLNVELLFSFMRKIFRNSRMLKLRNFISWRSRIIHLFCFFHHQTKCRLMKWADSTASMITSSSTLVPFLWQFRHWFSFPMDYFPYVCRFCFRLFSIKMKRYYPELYLGVLSEKLIFSLYL